MRDNEGDTDGAPASIPGDAELLARRAVQREAAAWEQLFDLHYRNVFAFVRYRLRSAEEAEDIASQAFEQQRRGVPQVPSVSRTVVTSSVRMRHSGANRRFVGGTPTMLFTPK